jgi:hypothetical protein
MFLGLPDPDPLVGGKDMDPAPESGSFPFLIKVLSVERTETMLAK